MGLDKNHASCEDVGEYHSRKCNEKSSQTIIKTQAMLE